MQVTSNALAAFLLLAGLGFAAWRFDAVPAAPPSVSIPSEEMIAEAAALARFPGVATRRGTELHIRLHKGAIVIRRNDERCITPEAPSALCEVFTFLEVLQGCYALVRHGYYEGHDNELIDLRTGAGANTFDMPRFSPSGRRLVSIGNDYAYGPYGVLIQSVEEGRIVKEHLADWPILPFFFASDRWVGEEAIELHATRDPPCTPRDAPVPVRLARAADGVWAIDVGGTAACP